MLEKIGIFIIFLGPLVFFHELGHYLFARLFGVKVEVFSIGFGPKLFKFRFSPDSTEYTISLIPLGGYVKMFGDDPLNKEAIADEQRDQSFVFKSKWARFWIVLGGPLANFILAYAIFWSLLMSGEKLPEIRMGALNPASNFYEMGFRSGDALKKVNGKEIYNPTDIVLEGKDLIKTITVARLGSQKKVIVNKAGEEFFNEFLKYPPVLRKPIVTDINGNFVGLSLESEKINWNLSFDEINHMARSGKIVYLYNLEKDKEALNGYKVDPKPFNNFQILVKSSLNDKMGELNYRTLDMNVRSVNMQSAADKAGIKESDTIVALNGKEVFSFIQLRANLQETKETEVKLSYWRSGKLLETKLTPEIKTQEGKAIKLIGVYSAGEFLGLRFIETKSLGIWNSTVKSFYRTWETIVKTVSSFKKLFTAEVSLKSIGGPLAIGKVASDSFNTSITYFFQLMALISINLGVINLFPIPVLDGGHIMFIFLEILNRGPVSRRKMEIAQQVGLSILLMLMVGAIFNDFRQFF